MLRSGMPRKKFVGQRESAARLAGAALVTAAMLAAMLAAIPAGAQGLAGWKLRVDGSTAAVDPGKAPLVEFSGINGTFRARNGHAATYFNPANTASGNYSLKGTFNVLRTTSPVEYYGLIFGGSGLDGARQNYLYFMVAGNGSWLFKRRVGDDTEEIGGPAEHAAVKKLDGGKAVNALEVRVRADKIECLINGTVVHTAPKSGKTAKTDGIYGFRINHLLEIQVDGFAVSPL